jgi:hypothetical protein
MNEQTKELAMKYANKMGNSVLHNAEHLEKFAELIIRECSQMVEDKFDFCGDEIIIAEQILKHFGVEESRQEKFRKSFKEAFKDGVDLSGRETP